MRCPHIYIHARASRRCSCILRYLFFIPRSASYFFKKKNAMSEEKEAQGQACELYKNRTGVRLASPS